MKRILAIALFMVAACGMAQQAKVRIDVDGRADQIPLVTGECDSALSAGNPGWMKDKKEYYLQLVSNGGISNAWTAYKFSFTPGKDGMVKLVLMGPDITGQPFVNYDNLLAVGAEIKNPDFEDVSSRGLFTDWSSYRESVVTGKDDAQSGRNYVKVSIGRTVWQMIEVKKGQEVTIKFSIKLAETEK